MIFEAADFVFEPPPQIRWARRILIKPCASYPLPSPITTSRESLEMVISGIRRVSKADIILLEGSPRQESMRSIYRALGYDFPRVLALDVKDCVLVEVENPLARPFALSTFWLPNVLLYCDYLISITPFKVFAKQGSFSIKNSLSLLPVSKYQGEGGNDWGVLYSLGIDKVIADLYFTLPFDLGIIDAQQKFFGTTEPGEGRVEDYGKIFVGEPYQVDCEASQSISLVTEYLQLVEIAKTQLASAEMDSLSGI
ncbi:MAG TPA: DUF362 domain-containing protein [Dehalococcoidia bacterium]|nr:DUF362 domain-containing protein [Dehalococcoidia bacterium]